MSERQLHTEAPSPRARHQLRVAVFDLPDSNLENAVLIGNMRRDQLLIRDFQVVNDQGLPGICNEERAKAIGSRLIKPFGRHGDITTLYRYQTQEEIENGIEPEEVMAVRIVRDTPIVVLPPMDTIGPISNSSDTVRGHAVVLREPLGARNLAAGLMPYNAQDAYKLAHKELTNEGSTGLDQIDAELIVSGFNTIKNNIKELSHIALKTVASNITPPQPIAPPSYSSEQLKQAIFLTNLVSPR